eukprot:8801569-Prorocentrum_lima.AAC.1
MPFSRHVGRGIWLMAVLADRTPSSSYDQPPGRISAGETLPWRGDCVSIPPLRAIPRTTNLSLIHI